MDIKIKADLIDVWDGETVCTTNRRLQNYLYILGIKSTGYEKNWDGYTVWSYTVTPEFRRAVKDFGSMTTRRRAIIESSTRNY